MAPIIHCVRHAEGFHNLGVEFHSLVDPQLTPYGESQCATLCSSLGPEFLSRLSLIAASPLTRTLNTAFLSFKPAFHSEEDVEGQKKKKELKILAVPDTQEISNYPCDTGSDPDVLRAMVADHDWPVDLSLVHEGWNSNTGRYAPAAEAITARARDARRLLRQKATELQQQCLKTGTQQEPELVLVSHGGFLHYFTGDWEDSTRGLGTAWTNCEIRSYHFASQLQTEDEETEEEEEAWLVETPASRQKRGKESPTPGRAEQERLFQLALEGWTAQGLVTPLSASDRVGTGNEAEGDTEQGTEIDGAQEREVQVVA